MAAITTQEELATRLHTMEMELAQQRARATSLEELARAKTELAQETAGRAHEVAEREDLETRLTSTLEELDGK